MMRGQVVFRSSRQVAVSVGDERWTCDLRGSLRKGQRHNAIVVGDFVEFTPGPDESGCVDRVLERRNWLSRKRAVGGGRELVLAANIDQVLAVFSVQQPRLKFGALDRLLVASESQGLPATILLNKTDLGIPDGLEDRMKVYPELGYPVHFVSVEEERGLDEVRAALVGKSSVVAGPSGVGKSSLLNRIIPGLGAEVGAVSAHNEKGRHTTTAVRWHTIPGGGAFVDTPGFREYALWGLPHRELAALMPDLAELAGQCRFSNCLHVAEPDCAVRSAAESGEIAPERYRSYQYILESL